MPKDENLSQITKEVFGDGYIPDPKGHLYVSIVKSILRIIAGFSLLYGNVFFAGVFLILAELLGILEELV